MKNNPTGQNTSAADMIAPILTLPMIISQIQPETYFLIFAEWITSGLDEMLLESVPRGRSRTKDLIKCFGCQKNPQ